jgi:hypothetical protein
MAPRDWRLQADYAALEDLSAAGFAWEFLRRNPAYRSDHEAAVRGESGRASPGPGGGPAPRWGLSFLGRSDARRRRGACLLAT